MTETEVRAWLNRGFRIRQEIASLERTAASVRDRLTATTPNLGGTGGGSGEKHKLDRLPEITFEIDRERKRLDAVLAEIERAVQQVPDARLRNVLRERYVAGFRWERISGDLHYSAKQVKRQHKRALEAVAPVIEKMSL